MNGGWRVLIRESLTPESDARLSSGNCRQPCMREIPLDACRASPLLQQQPERGSTEIRHGRRASVFAEKRCKLNTNTRFGYIHTHYGY
jgi:hypothetical protein